MAGKTSTSDDTTSNKRLKVLPSQCKICEAPALYSYYGVIVCYPCKIFFKRNAEKRQTSSKCDGSNDCEVTANNRNICASCRLAKCFQIGMKSDLFRPSLVPKKRINQTTTTTFSPTLNILQKDKFLLNQNEWNLISNLSHTYDLSNILSIIQSFQNQSEFINQEFLQQLISIFYETAESCLCKNEDLTNLSSNDRSILISTAVDNVTCFGGVYICSKSQLFNNKGLMNHFEMIYGTNTIENHRWSSHFTESDPSIFQLAIALFIFSTNSRTFHRNISMEFSNMNSMLEIENKYAEVIWKYLVYKYKYDQAIKTFMNIIQWFLAITIFMSFADNNQVHINDIQLSIEQIELVLVLDDVDRIIQTNN